MRTKHRGKINIPAIVAALEDAERFISSEDKDRQEIGKSMKRFFELLLAKRQRELREAIEKSAKLKKQKIWREVPKKND